MLREAAVKGTPNEDRQRVTPVRSSRTSVSAKLFGARETYVGFNPDISDNSMLEINGSKINGRYFRQEYALKGGKAVGHYSSEAICRRGTSKHFLRWMRR